MNKETENKSNINIDREKKRKFVRIKIILLKLSFTYLRQFDDQYYAGLPHNGCVLLSWPAFQHLIVLSQVLGVFGLLSLDIIKHWSTNNETIRRIFRA